MSSVEIRELIPFYVAGTLSDTEQREVEAALKNSAELQQELAFWQRAKAATIAETESVVVGHLSAKQIVDLATWTASAEERVLADRHLESCASCSEEHRLVLESLAAQPSLQSTFVQRLLHSLTSIRVSYAVPVAAAVIALAAFFLSRTLKEHVQQPATDIAQQQATIIPHVDNEVKSLWLSYQPEMRGGQHARTYTLLTDGNHEPTLVHVAVPHSAVNGIRYTVALAFAGTRVVHLPQTVQRYASSAAYDSLKFELAMDSLPLAGNTMRIVLKEVLPKTLKDLTPEEYQFVVTVRNKIGNQ
jgi:anti-sigma-K factor RskA